ncbi:VanZ family protein [Hoyosella altamirensis]|uniref:VanZ family protein n=1 Tax=Hoyosella altamirensis TaxID=616997 RepID=A0A839RG67_9ACTN|nr:VanZ family protein [Hoyosella altamirensis]MBB3035595.1 VanZ family protein [Hoyosella altamirensis]
MWRRIPLAITFVVACVMLFGPAPDAPSPIPHLDKAVHFVLFAALALTSRFAQIRAFPTLLWVCAFAVLSELLQGALPGNRTADALDVAADIAGAIAGLMAARATFLHSSGRASAEHSHPSNR